MGRSVGLLLARCALASIFLYTGWDTLFHLSGTAADIAARGYPMPKVFAVLAMAAELLGGLSLVLGLFTRFGALALVVFLVPTTYSYHLLGAISGPAAGRHQQMISVLKNLAIIGGLISLWFSGPGSLSVDGRMRGGSA